MKSCVFYMKLALTLLGSFLGLIEADDSFDNPPLCIDPFQVLILQDATHSMDNMYSNMAASQISKMMSILDVLNPGSEWGLVSFRDKPIEPLGIAGTSEDEYRDYCGEKEIDFTTNSTELRTWYSQASSQGGGDSPEAQYYAIYRSLMSGEFIWSQPKRLLLLITDSAPHYPRDGHTDRFAFQDFSGLTFDTQSCVAEQYPSADQVKWAIRRLQIVIGFLIIDRDNALEFWASFNAQLQQSNSTLQSIRPDGRDVAHKFFHILIAARDAFCSIPQITTPSPAETSSSMMPSTQRTEPASSAAATSSSMMPSTQRTEPASSAAATSSSMMPSTQRTELASSEVGASSFMTRSTQWTEPVSSGAGASSSLMPSTQRTVPLSSSMGTYSNHTETVWTNTAGSASPSGETSRGVTEPASFSASNASSAISQPTHSGVTHSSYSSPGSQTTETLADWTIPGATLPNNDTSDEMTGAGSSGTIPASSAISQVTQPGLTHASHSSIGSHTMPTMAEWTIPGATLPNDDTSDEMTGAGSSGAPSASGTESKPTPSGIPDASQPVFPATTDPGLPPSGEVSEEVPTHGADNSGEGEDVPWYTGYHANTFPIVEYPTAPQIAPPGTTVGLAVPPTVPFVPGHNVTLTALPDHGSVVESAAADKGFLEKTSVSPEPPASAPWDEETCLGDELGEEVEEACSVKGEPKVHSSYYHCLFTKLSESDATVLIPSSAEYNAAIVPYNLAMPTAHPVALIYAHTVEGVKEAVKCSAENTISLVPRSGGHDYSCMAYGTDSTSVLDVSALSQIIVDQESETAEIGPGARIANLYYQLYHQGGFMLPMGACTSIGFGGHVLGGGYGFYSRAFGLVSDYVLEIDIVLANGELVTATYDNEYSDLFWALRGAGNGNFGVATRFKMQLIRAPPSITSASLLWMGPLHRPILEAFVHWAVNAPPGLSVSLAAVRNRTMVQTAYIGEIDQFWTAVRSFTNSVPHVLPFIRQSNILESAAELSITDMNDLNDPVALHPVRKAPNIEYMNGPNIPVKNKFRAHNAFWTLDHKLNETVIEALDEILQRSPPDYGYALELFAGQQSRLNVPVDSAYPHRNAQFIMHMYIRAHEQVAGELQYDYVTTAYHQLIRPLAAENVYVNFADYTLRNATSHYFVHNLPRLRQIKAKYDPYEVFWFPQSISPAASS
eukprot:Gregarina_sp_Poly_1__646@NODE_1153_length_4925_cov_589_087279_g776_i1_p1_GENE_NODE_1153_length_4925_cov_589_087279_g776_i1NODE_1153_length_4925_cov_589_087279_g776_i1_p1_ORF_typecomplete_len1182_score161_81FAD_binding_4/PF01565_23/2_6e31Integrin_beta/PF00362_18/2_2e18Integrin_beta/PF00362_18/3_8e03BBE/PF08031_12/4e14VWA/PF00092_28/0_0015_NODE_1153_length_4925_cov_589_087279_g776_i12423787